MHSICGALKNAPEAALLCQTLARLAEEETGVRLAMSMAPAPHSKDKEADYDQALGRQGRPEGGFL